MFWHANKISCESDLNSFAADVEFSRHAVLEFPVQMLSFFDIVNNRKEPFGISIYRGITALKLLCIPSWTFSVTISDIYWQKGDSFLLFSWRRIFDRSNTSVIVTPLWSRFASNEKGFCKLSVFIYQRSRRNLLHVKLSVSKHRTGMFFPFFLRSVLASWQSHRVYWWWPINCIL